MDRMIVDLLEAGLFRTLLDVQCFDLKAVESYRRNAAHQAMSASMYANPHNRGAVVNQLDAMILGAAEMDLDFNVNVTTGTNGRIIGGLGGHSDTAAGAKLALVTTQLLGGVATPKIVECVTTITTPGETIISSTCLPTPSRGKTDRAHRRLDLTHRGAGIGCRVAELGDGLLERVRLSGSLSGPPEHDAEVKAQKSV